ncbi:MAG: hypothetical protein ACTSYA_10365 [Candidatus Kariarchaeaceae archaeon]
MKTIDRIKQFIDSQAISLNSFDKKIGASNGYIGKQISKSASIGSDIIEKIISTYTDLNPHWLLTGEGPMLKDDQNETPINVVNEPEPTYGKKMIALEEGDYKEIMKKLDQQQKDIEVHQAEIEALNNTYGDIVLKLSSAIKKIEKVEEKIKIKKA